MIELAILGCVILLSTLIWIFILRKRWRIALFAALFKQYITWILGAIPVEYGWIEYPVRTFPEVNRTSIVYEFYAFPTVCGLYNAFYPYNKSIWLRFLYSLLFTSVLTVVEVIMERFTEVVHYHEWTWYWTFLSLWATFVASRLACIWFFRKAGAGSETGGATGSGAGREVGGS